MSGPFGSGSFGTSIFSNQPFYTSKGLIDAILRDTSHGDPSRETIKRQVVLGMINNTYSKAATLRDWDWLYQTEDFNFDAPWSLGTINVTQNSEVVTGTGTAFSANVVPNNALVVSNRDERYIIESVESQTGLTLEGRFAGETATEQEFSIIKPIYRAPAHLDAIQSIVLQGFNEMEPMGTQEFRRIQAKNISLTGIPRYYTEVGRRAQDGRRMFEIYPAPDQAYIAQLNFSVNLMRLEDSDANFPLIPDRYRALLYFGGMAQFQAYLSQPEKATYYENKHNEMLVTMLTDSKLTDSRLMFQPSRNYRNRRRPYARAYIDPRDFSRGQ